MSEYLPEPGEVYNDAVFDSEVLITDVTEENVLARDIEVAEEKGEDGGNIYPIWMWEHNRKVGRFTPVENHELEDEGLTFDQEGESGPNWGDETDTEEEDTESVFEI